MIVRIEKERDPRKKAVHIEWGDAPLPRVGEYVESDHLSGEVIGVLWRVNEVAGKYHPEQMVVVTLR